ncbi:MAG: undecaprenyldiphospho-muramoylpentapeptide beta-N-acetylglucosaminyltransferase [Verrucomicrobiota bacterium]
MQPSPPNPFVAIACGGTGGHLFPGIAVAEELLQRDCDVALLISPKEVDQQAVKALIGVEVVTLPAVGLTRGGFFGFASGFRKSYRAAKTLFAKRAPQAVLAMGGFTSAPPVLAARKFGAKTFLHESNTMPGRANRWLAHFVDEAFVYFHEASGRMSIARSRVTGMPVRSRFNEKIDPAAARMSLGLDPQKPVLLVMGGSQGASGINNLVMAALPLFSARLPELQIIHLTGATDFEKVKAGYQSQNLKAVVRPFLTEMEFALNAASVAVSRSGASSLAEIAASRLPAILIPYPTATDDHQYYNALAFVETDAAKMLEQSGATAEIFSQAVCDLLQNENERAGLQRALARWHSPNAAAQIAEFILSSLTGSQREGISTISLPPFQKTPGHHEREMSRG